MHLEEHFGSFYYMENSCKFTICNKLINYIYKMRITTLSVCLVLFILSTSVLNAQSRRIERANQAYEEGEYNRAVELLREAYSSVNDFELRSEMIFRIARSYYKLRNPRQAEMWFGHAVNRNYPDPLVHLYYGEVLKMNEKYDEALEQFEIFSELVPDDPRGPNGIESCTLAIEWMDNPTPYVIEDMKFFNSRYRDYSPAFAKEDYSVVYFTSTRENDISDDIHGVTGEYFSNIFETRRDRQGRWSDPAPLDGNINSRFDEGTPSFSGDYTAMYFTSCRVTREVSGCQIFVTNRRRDRWERPGRLELTDDTLIAAHPAVSPNELTLYFVSDMPGSYGEKDIWKVTRRSVQDSWGEPENLGPEINTTGNEVFPFVHPDGTIYFSSDGHPGMGGLDIFKATKNGDGSWNVRNMGYPVNSPADDFGIVFEKDTERGFFTSNRGRMNIDNIYSFHLPPVVLNAGGVVTDRDSGEPLPGSVVTMVGSDGTIMEMDTGDNARFRFTMLRPDVEYIFLASQDGYLTERVSVSTAGLERSREFEVNIAIQSYEKPIELPNIFYDFAMWDLRPESKEALDRLVQTLKNNPNIVIELASHTDSRGGREFNLELSQKRAQSVVNYLIENGISPDRLVAKGYADSSPKVVDEEISSEHSFLPEGQPLTEEFINTLPTEEQREAAHQINRRTEFSVIRDDYGE